MSNAFQDVATVVDVYLYEEKRDRSGQQPAPEGYEVLAEAVVDECGDVFDRVRLPLQTSGCPAMEERWCLDCNEVAVVQTYVHQRWPRSEPPYFEVDYTYNVVEPGDVITLPSPKVAS